MVSVLSQGGSTLSRTDTQNIDESEQTLNIENESRHHTCDQKVILMAHGMVAAPTKVHCISDEM